MNMQDARKLQPGAIVREAYRPDEPGVTAPRGLVLGKEYVEQDHVARCLSQRKDRRFDVYVHWFDGPRRWSRDKNNPEKLQNWEIMVVEHV